ncbi:alpha-1,2-fucosyltransferase [Pseudoalteromonas sp. B160]|uniref:alpha-1,2-fucosyltransferase n=1 Tax=Pseudoalteromonas sp. B160 TaxID=630414 RepID=UPI00301D6CE8
MIKTLLIKKITKDNLFSAPNNYSKKRYYGYYAKGKHLNENIFLKLRNIIIKNNDSSIKPKNANFCAIHLRRGDFPKNYALTLDYYASALKCIDWVDEYILVTDSRTVYDEVKLKLKCNIHLSSASNMKDDFFEMFNAKNIIMSNSTFCYWATVLGESQYIVHPDKISTDIDWFFYLNKKSSSIFSTFESEQIK